LFTHRVGLVELNSGDSLELLDVGDATKELRTSATHVADAPWTKVIVSPPEVLVDEASCSERIVFDVQFSPFSPLDSSSFLFDCNSSNQTAFQMNIGVRVEGPAFCLSSVDFPLTIQSPTDLPNQLAISVENSSWQLGVTASQTLRNVHVAPSAITISHFTQNFDLELIWHPDCLKGVVFMQPFANSNFSIRMTWPTKLLAHNSARHEYQLRALHGACNGWDLPNKP